MKKIVLVLMLVILVCANVSAETIIRIDPNESDQSFSREEVYLGTLQDMNDIIINSDRD